MYDVFLSYNSEDYEAVETIARYLKESAGLKPWLDRWDLIPGESIIGSLQIGLKNSRTCAVFVGKSGEGPWQKQEIKAALRQQLEQTDFRVIPILLPQAPEQPELPSFLADNMWVTFVNGIEDDEAFWRLECGIRGIPPGAGRPTPRPPRLLQNSTDNSTSQAIEFVNRSQEIQFITSIGCPQYLLISAPTGYGKTRLIERVKQLFQDQNWLCVHLHLLRERTYFIQQLTYNVLQQLERQVIENAQLEWQGIEHAQFKRQGIEHADLSTPEECGVEIGKSILEAFQLAQDQVVLLIDGAEVIKKDGVEELFGLCIPSIIDTLNASAIPIQIRLLISGRDLSDWKQERRDILSEPYPLTPFNFSAVHQTVQAFARTHVDRTPAYKRTFAAHLMFFTGGHPACMAKILSRDFGNPLSMITARESDYYEAIIFPVISEIRAQIPDALKRIFETLSVVRRYDPGLLQWFINNKLISWSRNQYTLEEHLLQTYLISKDRTNGFLGDDITRRLLAIYLRRTEPDYFLKVCEGSIAFYTSVLEDSRCLRPDFIAIELLFQQLQYQFYQHQRVEKTVLLESLRKILDMLTSERDARKVLDLFKGNLERDWEFRFAVNYFLREGDYDDKILFNEILDHVTRYRQHV